MIGPSSEKWKQKVFDGIFSLVFIWNSFLCKQRLNLASYSLYAVWILSPQMASNVSDFWDTLILIAIHIIWTLYIPHQSENAFPWLSTCVTFLNVWWRRTAFLSSQMLLLLLVTCFMFRLWIWRVLILWSVLLTLLYNIMVGMQLPLVILP